MASETSVSHPASSGAHVCGDYILTSTGMQGWGGAWGVHTGVKACMCVSTWVYKPLGAEDKAMYKGSCGKVGHPGVH